MVPPGRSGFHLAIMPFPVEISTKVLICPCFLTPSVEACTDQTAANSESNYPQVKVIADLAKTINSIVKTGILSSFLFPWFI